MKFKNFVKSLASSGILYQRSNGERWLGDGEVMMKIPDGTRSITAKSIVDMPEFEEKIIDSISGNLEAKLSMAYMPIPEGAIKDCIRRYTSTSDEVCFDISNDAWKLIDKSDDVAIHIHMDPDTLDVNAQALMVSQYPKRTSDNGMELVGIILPVTLDEE